MPSRRSRRGDDDLIDRNPQNLPVPMGDFAPVHQSRRTKPLVKWWRRNSATAVVLVGLVGAGLGAYLAWQGPQVAVYAQGSKVVVNGSTLTLDHSQSTSTTSVFTGAATLEIVNLGNSKERAAAVTYTRGTKQTGVCNLAETAPGQLRETCSFLDGTVHVSSTDTLNAKAGSYWVRHYSDGRSVTIQVPPGASVIPVPFLVGY